MAKQRSSTNELDPIEIEIDQLFDHMILCLNQRRGAVISSYHELRDEIAKRPQAREKKLAELVGMKEAMEGILQSNQLSEFLNKSLSDINSKIEQVEKPQTDTCAVFRSQSEALEQLIAEVGEVLEEEVKNIQSYQSLRAGVTVGSWGKAPGELYKPHAVAIDSIKKRIFVAEGDQTIHYSHARISVFSENGKFIESLKHQDMKWPIGLATHGDNLYVTDVKSHSIFQFKITKKFSFVTKLGIEGTNIGEFVCPTSLAVSTTGDLYVVDYHTGRVQIFNRSLRYLDKLTSQPIEEPFDIKLTASEVYVLCNGSPCLLIFSYQGVKLRSLLSKGKETGVMDPRYFCLDSVENIVISDSSAHNLKVFTKEGTLISKIGEEGHQAGMLYSPSGLALTKGFGIVVVSDNITFGLQIFS